MARVDRMMAVLLRLRAGRQVTARDLAEELEVSVRTVYRDIDALCGAGVPIASRQGPSGGYSLMEGYFVPPVMLTVEEASAIFAAANYLKKLPGSPFGPSLEGALLKLKAVLPDHVRGLVELACRSVVFEDPRERGYRLPDGLLETVHLCLVRRRSLRISYTSADGGRSSRDVDPYGLMCDGGTWYLVGFCNLRGALRMFRADRIDRFEPLDRPYRIPEGFDLSVMLGREWLRKAADEWMKSSSVLLRVDPANAERLAGSPFARAVPGGDGCPGGPPPDGPPGWVTFRMAGGDVAHVLRSVMEMGGGAEVIEPAELREAVADELRRALRLYEG